MPDEKPPPNYNPFPPGQSRRSMVIELEVKIWAKCSAAP